MLSGRSRLCGWHEVREVVGEPTVIVHDLRGTAASLLLASGVSVIAVAEHLGHDPKVLLATYAAAMRRESSTVAAVLEGAALPRGQEKGLAGDILRR